MWVIGVTYEGFDPDSGFWMNSQTSKIEKGIGTLVLTMQCNKETHVFPIPRVHAVAGMLFSQFLVCLHACKVDSIYQNERAPKITNILSIFENRRKEYIR